MGISQADIHSSEEAVAKQKSHPLVETRTFTSLEEYFLYLMHRKAYETAAELAAGKSLLDWGCNNGYGIEIMRPYVKYIAGLDVAEHAIISAHHRLPELKGDIRLYDGHGVPFAPESFDVVTSFQVLEHVADYHSYLSAIAQSLRPAGIAIFTTPNRSIRLEAGMKPWNPFHVHEFSADELKSKLSGYFSHVKIKGLRGLPEIEAIEKKRCLRHREAAKHPQAFSWYRLSRRAHSLLSRPFFKGGQRILDPQFLERYGTTDFRYVEIDLDAAIDFMAICTK